MNYYYSIDGTDVIGPCSLAELTSFFATGVLPTSAQVCAEGQQTWQPLSEVIDTRSGRPAQDPVRPQVRAPAARPPSVQPPPLPLPLGSQAPPKSSSSQIGGGVIVALIILGAYIWPKLNSGGDSGSSLPPEPTSPTSAVAPKPASNISSVENAKVFVVGTWTYTGQNLKMLDRPLWARWIIKSDGTIDMFSARPSDDNWGKMESNKYAVYTDKYFDSGERFYALRVEGVFKPIVINTDGTLRNRSVDWDVNMTRGDKFPFSK